MTSVTSLLETPFLKRDVMEKLLVQESARPMPHLNMAAMEMVNGKSVVHYFTSDIYKKNEWICGCPERNALFCYPCLLFEGRDLWSKTGYSHLGHLQNAISKHETTAYHKRNMISFSRFSVHKKAINEESESSFNQKKIQIMIALIETVKFCALNSIPIAEQDEHNSHSFLDILKVITPSDSTVNSILQNKPFDDLESIKKDILKISAEIIRDKIVEEIREAQYVSLIVEGGDSRYPRIIILRYVRGFEPVERIWKIINNENMKSFPHDLIEDLRSTMISPIEIISQSFDQITLKKKDSSVNLPAKIQPFFQQIPLVHLYRQDLFDIIYNVATIQKHFQIFVSMIHGISTLMTDDTGSSATVRTIFETERIRQNNLSNLDFAKERLESVFLYRKVLSATFNNITKNPSDHSDHVVCLASNFSSMLQDDLCSYMLETFYKMSPHFNKYISDYKDCSENSLDLDSNVIRYILDCPIPGQLNVDHSASINLQPGEIQVKIENELDIECEDFSSVASIEEEIEVKREFELPMSPGPSKRKFGDNNEDKQKETTIAIVEQVAKQLQDLLRFRVNMYASKMVDPKNFKLFSTSFPEDMFVNVTNMHYFSAYGTMQLKTELKVLYDHCDFQLLRSTCDVLKKISTDNLISTFPETVKLIKIVLTYPSLTDDPKRCFDTKNKVRNFLSDSQGFSYVDCLVYFGCEADLIENVKDFNQKVLEKSKMLPERLVYLLG